MIDLLNWLLQEQACRSFVFLLESALPKVKSIIPFYLDQNVLSQLQPDCAQRSDMLGILNPVRDGGGGFVYSHIHIDEILASGRPEVFAAILEELDACYVTLKQGEFEVCQQTPHQVILEREDGSEKAGAALMQALSLSQYALAWMPQADAEELVEELAKGIEEYVRTLEPLPSSQRHLLEKMATDVGAQIRGMNLNLLREEATTARQELREKLPKSQAEIDQIRDEDCVDFLFDCAGDSSIQRSFPKHDWEIYRRSDGSITGLAFMLYAMGLVRAKEAEKGAPKPFISQFRDCMHIDFAAHCAAFVTFDRKAARLARAVYGYVGTTAKVLELFVKR